VQGRYGTSLINGIITVLSKGGIERISKGEQNSEKVPKYKKSPARQLLKMIALSAAEVRRPFEEGRDVEDRTAFDENGCWYLSKS